MLRASSEMAVATSVAWLAENPNCSAIIRPLYRAATRSLSDASGTWTSISSLGVTLAAMPRFLPIIKISKTFLEIERGGDIFQRNSELHHGKGDLGLDADDHGLRAAQPDHVGKIA